MSEPVQTGLTWDDLLAFGEDGVRRELIDGALYVSPAARYRHQHVVARLCAYILAYVEERGGSVAAAPTSTSPTGTRSHRMWWCSRPTTCTASRD